MKLKKIASLFCASLMFLGTIYPSYALNFSDLKGYSWAEKYITDVSNKGIINGYPDGTFKPGLSVTMIESLVMIANLSPKSEIDMIYKNNASKYDLASNGIDEWARPYIVFALEKGILPKEALHSLVNKNKIPINALRFQVCVFLVRGLRLENELNHNATLTYKDTNDIKSIGSEQKGTKGMAVPYVELLQRKGIISKQGDGSGNFFPKKTITRAEIAVMVSNAYKYSPKAKAQSSINPIAPVQETVRGKINLITFSDDNINFSVNTNENKIRSLVADKKSVSVTMDNKVLSLNDIKVGQEATFNLINGQVSKITLEQETIRYSGRLMEVSAQSKILSLKLQDSTLKTFKYTDNTQIYVNDKLTSIENLPIDVEIDLYAKADVIEKASINLTKSEITGEITDYNTNSITINTKNGIVKKDISKDIKIYRNDKRIDSISYVAIGDTAKAVIDNDKIVEITIDAPSQRYLSAVIKGIEMNSHYNKIIIGDKEGNEHILTVSNDSIIRINDVKSNIYSLKLGYEVDIYTKGAMIDEIISRGEYKQTTITGIVKNVDTVDKFIEVKQTNNSLIKVYYDKSTKIEKLNGTLIEARNIYADDTITGIGVLNGGNILATRIILDIQ